MMRGVRGVNFSVPSLKATTDTQRYAGQICFINVSASVAQDFTYSVCNSDVIGRILLLYRTISVALKEDQALADGTTIVKAYEKSGLRPDGPQVSSGTRRYRVLER